MKAHKIYKSVNGLFTLDKLKPSFIQFAKTDITDLILTTEEKSGLVLTDIQSKSIVRLFDGKDKTAKSSFPKNYMRKPKNWIATG